MNTIRLLKTIYLRPSRTIDIILLSNPIHNRTKIVYIYNYEGTHYRLFSCKRKVRDFFNNMDDDSVHFLKEQRADKYLFNYPI